LRMHMQHNIMDVAKNIISFLAFLSLRTCWAVFLKKQYFTK
jgi:hypothetical protein